MMKLSTSIRNAKIIAERVHRCNGLIGTSGALNEALRVKRMWVFGSTVKGKENPNDTDILIECETAGRFCYQNAKLHPISTARNGFRYKVSSIDVAYSYLRGNLKMVRLHDVNIDGSIATPRIMIYPRMELP
jgi:predicted nucleotidyltransferase